MPASASAATLGSLDPDATDPGSGGLCVASQGNFLQGSIAPGSPSYTVPAGGGVITGWRTRWGTAGSQVVFQIWRSDPDASGGYKLIARDPEVLAPDSDGVSSYHVSIPVQAGDVLGIGWPTANTVRCSYQSPNEADEIWGRTGVTPVVGASENFESFIVTRDHLNVSADLAQAADLSVTGQAFPAAVRRGALAGFLLTVANQGPAAVNAVLSDALPGGFRLVAAVAGGGACSGGGPVTCSLSLGPGQSIPVLITASAGGPGLGSDVATVSSSATDPAPGDNRASVAVRTFSVPALGPVTVSRGSFRASKKTHVSFRFGVDQQARIDVAIRPLRGRKKVGTLHLSAHAGSNELAFTGRVGGRWLGRGRYLATFTASDEAGTSRTRTVRFRIL